MNRSFARQIAPPTGAQRVAAVVSLVSGSATLVLALTVAFRQFPRGLVVLACVLLAVAAAWYGVLRRGTERVLGLGVAAVAVVGVAALMVFDGGVLQLVLIVIGVLIWHASATIAFRSHVRIAAAPPPKRPVLFVNPRSGGGKAAKASLAAEAEARGIGTVELHPGEDLGVLVRSAVDGGADAIAMAGGDGSQAVVATIAAEKGLPYACVPAGTRNHFALDLGVDRDDVVGALDAFVDGGECRVDLATVNGRVFVNNVSIGLYALAVQRIGYRDAKIRTLLGTVPDVLGPDGNTPALHWGESGREEHARVAAVLVSNNPYRLGRGIGSGTRPRLDGGLLGIVVLDAPEGNGGVLPKRPWREWSSTDFRIDSDSPIPMGVDGEAVTLDPPACFAVRRQVLHVRIARHHPGASPSAMVPNGVVEGFRSLCGIAAGHHRSGEPENTSREGERSPTT
jgi:hypothetical protein